MLAADPRRNTGQSLPTKCIRVVASFETRPFGALLRMRLNLCGTKKKPHAEEAASFDRLRMRAAVSKHA